MESRDRQHALVEAGIALAAEPQLDTILEKLVATAAVLTGARYAALGVLGRGRQLERFFAHGIEGDARAAIGEEPHGLGLLGTVVDATQPVRIDDIAADPRSVGFPPNHPPMRTFLGVPLRVRGRVFGNLYLCEKEGGAPFDEEDEEVTTLLAAQAAVAIENARRVERDVFTRVVEAQEVERRRLARGLHDGTGQALTSVLLGLGIVERAETLEAAQSAAASLRVLVASTLEDVRRLAVELRPKALDDFGLGPALRRLGESVRETTGLDVQVEVQPPDPRFRPRLETAAYRIVQETLTNILRHASAQHASVVVTVHSGTLSIVVEDDGVGFDPAARADGFGLAGIRERAVLLDGSFRIESRKGHGTTIVVTLPVGSPE